MATPSTVKVGARQVRSNVYLATVVIFGTFAVLLGGFDSIARSDALPVILKSLHISVGTGSLVFSASFVVTFLGNLVLGELLDRIGRKKLFIWTLLISTLFSVLTAAVTNAWEYAIIGALAGTTLCVLQSSEVFVSEEVPAKWRGTLMGIVMAGFSGGSIIISLVASAILPSGDWRLLFLLAIVPVVVLAILSAFFLREPPRSQEALAIKRARRRGEAVETHYAIDAEKAKQSEWRQLFAPDLRRQTILTSAFGFLMNFGNGMVLVLGVTYLTLYDHLGIGAADFSFAIEGFASLVGVLVVGFLADYIGARTILIIWPIVGGIMVGLLAIHGGVGWADFIMAGYGFIGQGVTGCWTRYLTDSFPTRVRGTGVSFVTALYFLGGGAFAPAIYGAVMNAGHYVLSALLSAIIMIIGALILLGAKRIPPRKELEEIAI